MRSFSSGTPLAGRYVLVDQLATGPDATVWRGLDDVLGRPVAVKVFTSAAHDADDRAWIHQRARTAARLSHPHAAAVYDFGDARGLDETLVPYVVLELLDGVPLAERLADGPLPWPLSVRTAAEVASALAAAHARGVVHGDLGPGSVLLTDVGAKIIGFAGPTRAPRVELTPADDVRALGVLLGRTLLGTDPHAGTPVEAFAYVAGLPDDAAVTCLDCLALRAGDRPPAEQVARRLATVVTQFAAAAEGEEVRLVPAVLARHRASMARHLKPSSGRGWSRTQAAGIAAAGVLVLLAASGLASGVGEDLISEATARFSGGGGAGATAPDARNAGPAAGSATGGSAGAGPTGLAGSGTPPPVSLGPSSSAMPSADPSASPTGTPVSEAEAMAQLRGTLNEGREEEKIDEDVAIMIGKEIDKIDKSPRRDMPSLVLQLKGRIVGWTQNGAVDPERAELLYDALDRWAEAAA
ncbi:MAG TPA: protein kinase [Micromonosporaceae bacterium]|nr:protein kinase [Micromonosporaceae bacterium]